MKALGDRGMEIIHPGHRRKGQLLRRGIAGFVGAALVLLGCVREPGPEEVALQYGRALYASDLVEAYRFISSEDRRVKDQSTFRRERGEAGGFALDVARQLASFIEATPFERTVRGKQATVRFKIRLPNANAPEIVGLVGEWDERHLNALPRTEQEKIPRELDRLHQVGGIPMLDGEETFELVQEASGWRVALNWAGGVQVRFQAAIQDGLPLRVAVLPEETRLFPGERVRVTVRATNLSTRMLVARVGHLVEPKPAGETLAMLQCPLLLPVTLKPGQTEEFVSEYMVLRDGGAAAELVRVTYEFRPERQDAGVGTWKAPAKAWR